MNLFVRYTAGTPRGCDHRFKSPTSFLFALIRFTHNFRHRSAKIIELRPQSLARQARDKARQSRGWVEGETGLLRSGFGGFLNGFGRQRWVVVNFQSDIEFCGSGRIDVFAAFVGVDDYEFGTVGQVAEHGTVQFDALTTDAASSMARQTGPTEARAFCDGPERFVFRKSIVDFAKDRRIANAAFVRHPRMKPRNACERQKKLSDAVEFSCARILPVLKSEP